MYENFSNAEMKKEIFEITVRADGGARGNPGPAAYGFVIYAKDAKVLHQEAELIGVSTNNIAEYKGVIGALRWISGNLSGVKVIQFLLDSTLVANQLKGKFKIKNEELRNLYFTVKNLIEKIGAKVSYITVPREENRAADRLVNLALDGKI